MSGKPYEFQKYTSKNQGISLPEDSRNAATVYFGFVGSNMIQYATAFAEEHGVQGSFRKAITEFLDYAKAKYLGPEHPCACLWIRFTVPSEDWQTPRPHLDGRYWDPKLDKPGKETFKVGACFVGPGTLFYDVSKCSQDGAIAANRTVSTEYWERARETGVDELDPGLRKWAHDRLVEMNVNPVQVPPNHCVRWVVGDPERAAIHSEPDQSEMPEGRVFIALLPGTEEQVRSHAKGWETPFHDATGVAAQPPLKSKI